MCRMKGVSMSELSDRLNYSKNYFSNLKCRNLLPTYPAMLMISEILDVGVLDLIDREPEQLFQKLAGGAK